MRELDDMPGHLIRRLQQIAVAVFHGEVTAGGSDLSPVQYAALKTIAQHPGLDQASLAGLIAYDRATIGGVVERLFLKGLITREVSATDRRARVLTVAPQGTTVLDAIEPSVRRAQEMMLEGLEPEEKAEFLRLLGKITDARNESSRAPRRKA
jgi:MarR family transcriptional regulator, temperature-dependent positive regulator of motility